MFWVLPYLLDAVPAARAKPSLWLSRAGAPRDGPLFECQNGLCHLDFRPSRLAVANGKGHAGTSRFAWLDQDFTSGTLYTFNLLLLWTITLKKQGADATRAIFADVVRKVCFGARAPELIQALDIDVGKEPHRDISEKPVGFIIARAFEVNAMGTSEAVSARKHKFLVGLASLVDRLIIDGRSGDARHAAPEGYGLRGPSGRRRRSDRDVIGQAECDYLSRGGAQPPRSRIG